MREPSPIVCRSYGLELTGGMCRENSTGAGMSLKQVAWACQDQSELLQVLLTPETDIDSQRIERQSLQRSNQLPLTIPGVHRLQQISTLSSPQ
jgi:hypothetical protein